MSIQKKGWIKTDTIFNKKEIKTLKSYFDFLKCSNSKVYQLKKIDLNLPEIKKAK